MEVSHNITKKDIKTAQDLLKKNIDGQANLMYTGMSVGDVNIE